MHGPGGESHLSALPQLPFKAYMMGTATSPPGSEFPVPSEPHWKWRCERGLAYKALPAVPGPHTLPVQGTNPDTEVVVRTDRTSTGRVQWTSWVLFKYPGTVFRLFHDCFKQGHFTRRIPHQWLHSWSRSEGQVRMGRGPRPLLPPE